MQYLEANDLGSAYTDAQSTARKSWLKYDEIERLAANEVRTDLPSNMPKVNDGSLRAAIKKIPKRLFAKPMEGVIKAVDRDEDWVAQLVDIILQKRIIPNATTDASFLRKWKVAVKNSKVYGCQPIYTFFTSHGTYTGADMSVPYIRNVYLEPGAISDLASDYIFMDSFYTKLKLKRLIDRVKQEMLEAEEGGYEYEGIWDAVLLQQVYDAGPSGIDSQNQTAAQRTGINRNEKGLYKLVTCFNRGYEAPFYTFAPNIGDKVVGTQYNTNPTGDLPIIYIYDDEDLVNPYGTGLVHDAGATQNVLDNLTQTDVLQTQIGSQSPIKIGGDRSQTNLKSFVYAPAAFWFTGNATVEPVDAVNPNIYNQFPGRFGLYKSQLQLQTGTFDNTVSSEAGNPGFSKTDAGVNALQSQTNADDNDTQQSIADAYSRVIKSMVNIHMNNMEGSELLKLEGDEIDRMTKTELLPVNPITGQPDTNEIELIWDNLRGEFDFEVDADSSKLKEDQNDAKALTDAITNYISSPVAAQALQQNGWKFDIGEAYVELFSKLGLKNIDKILVKISPEEQAEMEQAAMAGQIDPATGQPIQPAEDPNAMQEEVPEEAAAMPMDMTQQPQLGDEMNEPMQPPAMSQNIDDIMEQYNVDPDTAAGIAAAIDHGVDPAEYLAAQQGVQA